MRRIRPAAIALGLMIGGLAQPVGAQIGEEVREVRPRHGDSTAEHRAEVERHRAEMERHRQEMERHARAMNDALMRAYRDSSGALRMYRDGTLDSARARFLYRTSVGTPCARMGIAFDGDDTITVRDVMENSGAEEAGVREGDVIVSVNGQRANARVMAELAESMEAGERVRLVVRRNGREQNIDVTPREDVCPYRTMLSGEPFRVMCFTGDSTHAMSTDQDCENQFAVHLRGLEALETMPLRMYMQGDSAGWFKFEGFDGVRAFRDSVFIDLDSVRMMSDAFVFQLDSLRQLIPYTYHLADSIRMLMPEIELRMRENEDALHAHGLMLRSMELGMRALAGANVTELNDDLAEYFEAESGVLVTEVENATPAARAGLRAGDVIVSVNGNAVHDLDDLRRHAARGERPLELSVLRRGERRSIRLAE